MGRWYMSIGMVQTQGMRRAASLWLASIPLFPAPGADAGVVSYSLFPPSHRGATAIYLDTTYCKAKYAFPEQKESIAYVARTVKALLDKGPSAPQQQGQEGEEQIGREDEPGGGEEMEQQQQQQPMTSQGGNGAAHAHTLGAKPAIDANTAQGEGASRGLVTGSGAVGGDSSAVPGQQAWSSTGLKSTDATPTSVTHRQLFLISTYVIGKEKILFAVRVCHPAYQLHSQHGVWG